MEVETIIKKLRELVKSDLRFSCYACYYNRPMCITDGCQLMRDAANALERLNDFDQTNTARLLDRIRELQLENRLLQGALYNSAVHGHWSEEGCFYYCSVCGHMSGMETPYCSHCGAWMEVQDDDKHAEDHIDCDEA